MKIELINFCEKGLVMKSKNCGQVCTFHQYGGYNNGKYAVGFSFGDVIEKLLDLPEKKKRFYFEIDFR